MAPFPPRKRARARSATAPKSRRLRNPPEGPVLPKSSHPERESTHHKMKIGFLFPGQGAQRVGMGKELAREFPAARRVFEEADEALRFSLARLCFEGPEDELRLTANTQPATLATSIAALRAFQSECGANPELAAGHSLGEYSALVAAGAITLTDALRAVRERGRLMQEACPAGQGTMAAILGLDLPALKAL